MNLADHVLSRLLPDEEALIATRLPDFLTALRLLVTEGPAAAMNKVNATKKLESGS